MTDRDIVWLHGQINLLIDRVAKLERAAMHCDACGGRCDGDCEEGDEQFASGQPASAGKATVPAGWKLAPGWSLAPFGAVSCTHSDRDGKWDCDLDGLFENNHGACAAHAVEMGALVRDVPPAEQPSRQETGGGETWGSGQTQDYIAAETREQFVSNMDRARAKAKAAEQAQSDTWASVEKNAAEVRTWPAWKQQMAKAALGAKAAEQERASLHRVGCSREDGTWKCSPNCDIGKATQPGEPSGTGHVPGASVVEVVSEGPPTRSLADILRDPPKLNLSPPAPAAGTLSEAINALPEQVRRYVHEIETNCDPAGTVRDNVLLRDQLAALDERLAMETSLWTAELSLKAAHEAIEGKTGWIARARDLEARLADTDRDAKKGWAAGGEWMKRCKEAEAKLAQAERDASHHRALWLAEVAAREMAQANAAQAERERDIWKMRAGS